MFERECKGRGDGDVNTSVRETTSKLQRKERRKIQCEIYGSEV